MQAEIKKVLDDYLVKFDYNEKAIEILKEISPIRRKYYPETKTWKIINTDLDLVIRKFKEAKIFSQIYLIEKEKGVEITKELVSGNEIKQDLLFK